MVDNVQWDYLYVRSDDHVYAGSVQAVVHLMVGQTVWLRSDCRDNYFLTLWVLKTIEDTGPKISI